MPADAPQQVTDLFAIHRDLNKKNVQESYHDARQAVDRLAQHVQRRTMSIEERALIERLFWACAARSSGSSARWTTSRKS